MILLLLQFDAKQGNSMLLFMIYIFRELMYIIHIVKTKMPWNRGQEIIYVSCRLLDLISSAHRMGTHMPSLDNKVIEKHDDLRYIEIFIYLKV